MTRHPMRRATLLFLSSTILIACKDTTAPTTGTIAFDVVTTGADVDPDGYLVSVDGRAPQPIPANGSMSWSGDGGAHTLAFSGLAFNCDLTTPPTSASVTVGETTRLSIGASCAPYLRGAIVYTSEAFGFAEVMVMRPDGSRRQRLTMDQAVYASPAVSPDGQSIAVPSRLGGSWSGIYLLDRFGQTRTKLVGHSTFDGSPAWSPDGRTVAFRSETPSPSGSYGRIWLVGRDGTGLRQLTPDTTVFAYDDGPAWSPDGSRLVYSRNGVLWVINADGTGAASLGINGSYPAWSPDGRQVAYAWYVNNIQVILVADANGANARQLTTPVEGDQYPRWSPDGRQITFQRVAGGVFHIYAIAPDGTGVTMLSTAPQSESGASWSPNF